MIVVSNSSPITNLAVIGRLELLRQLYSTIHIPDAVYDEIVVRGAGKPGSTEVQTEAWFKRQPVTNSALVALLRSDLDDGEAEAVALASEVKADLLLLDDRAARSAAGGLGLKYVGLLGVLLEA